MVLGLGFGLDRARVQSLVGWGARTLVGQVAGLKRCVEAGLVVLCDLWIVGRVIVLCCVCWCALGGRWETGLGLRI